MSGVTGIFSNDKYVIEDEEVARLLFTFNFFEGHRGQGGAGAALVNPKRVKGLLKDMGPVRSAASYEELVSRLSDHTVFAGLGHTCYAKNRFLKKEDIHPVPVDSKNYEIHVSSDGILLQKERIRQKLEDRGYCFHSDTNGAAIGTLFASYLDQIDIPEKGNRTKAISEAIFEAGQKVIEETYGSGGFSTALLVRSKKDGKTRMVAMKDKTANKPMCYGRKGGTFFLASETYPLEHFKADEIQRVAGGDVVVFSENGIEKMNFGESRLEMPCIFEIIYFGGPEARVLENLGPAFPEMAKRLGRKADDGYMPTIYTVRKCLGLGWHDYWKNDVPEPNLISPVVDSGKGFTKGIASGYKTIDKYDEVIVKTDALKSFQIPEKAERWLENLIKYKLILDIIESKVPEDGSMFIGDDSIVRGGVGGLSAHEQYETSFFPRKNYGVIGMLESIANLNSIVMAISYGPMPYQCLYTFNEMERYAAQDSVGKPMIEICDDVSEILELGREERKLKVRYNPPETIYNICGRGFCAACMDGNYPVTDKFIPDEIKTRRDAHKLH